MNASSWWMLVLSLGSLTGCSVLEKARTCEQLAATVERQRAELAPALPENPSVQALEHKALLYKSLGKELKLESMSDKKMADARDDVVHQLRKVAKQLHRAAQAVTRLEESSRELEESAREDERTKRARERRETEEASSSEAADRTSVDAEGDQERTSKKDLRPGLDGTRATKHSPTREHSDREVLPAVEASTSEASANKRKTDRGPSPEEKARRAAQEAEREYKRAHHAAESAGRALEKAMRELSANCT